MSHTIGFKPVKWSDEEDERVLFYNAQGVSFPDMARMQLFVKNHRTPAALQQRYTYVRSLYDVQKKLPKRALKTIEDDSLGGSSYSVGAEDSLLLRLQSIHGAGSSAKPAK